MLKTQYYYLGIDDKWHKCSEEQCHRMSKIGVKVKKVVYDKPEPITPKWQHREFE